MLQGLVERLDGSQDTRTGIGIWLLQECRPGFLSFHSFFRTLSFMRTHMTVILAYVAKLASATWRLADQKNSRQT